MQENRADMLVPDQIGQLDDIATTDQEDVLVGEFSLLRSAIAAFVVCILGVIWLTAFLMLTTGIAHAAEIVGDASGTRLVMAHAFTSVVVLIAGSVTVYMLRDMAQHLDREPRRVRYPRKR